MTENSSLGVDDIKLLMGHYQNTMQMTTILQEQQKQLITLQKDIIKKQDSLIDKQAENGNQLKAIAEKMEGYIVAIQRLNETIQNSCDALDDSIQAQLTSDREIFSRWKVDVVKQHSGINKNVYIGWGILTTIIISLVGMLISIYDKFSLLKEIHTILNHLAVYFNIG